MSKICFLNTLLALIFTCHMHAESHPPIGFSYWDVGSLYDTIPSLFYNDTDYTPSGKNRWNTMRYRRNVERVASVVDSMKMPIVALFGVESEGVVRDIVVSSKLDYSYLHRTIDGRDGLDFALLYFGDILFIDYVTTFYGRIYIEGTIASKRIGIWLTRWGYLQKSASPPHREEVDMMIVAGGFYRNDIKKFGMVDQMDPHEAKGRGNAMSYRGWYMRHRIALEEGVEVAGSGVYITSWLLLDDLSAPMATFSGKSYLGGYSPYLPVFVYFEL